MKKEIGICPVCDGTKQVPISDNLKKWFPQRTTMDCLNCGGQYEFGTSSGLVPLNIDGIPCTHEYETHRKIAGLKGTSRTEYKCRHCNDTFVS